MLGGVIKGVVSRFLPVPLGDQDDKPVRLNRYGELSCYNTIRKQHALAEDGCYFTCNNAQAGLPSTATVTAFAATTPFLIIANTDNATPSGKSIFLDYATLVATATGTGGTSLQCAVVIDQGNRFVSGGTEITSNIVNVSMLSAQRNSITRVFAGAVTASAAGANARTVVGNRWLKGAIPVVGDEYGLNFGGVEAFNSITSATISKVIVNSPPIVVGPQQCALIYIWLPAQSGASSYNPEISWWER